MGLAFILYFILIKAAKEDKHYVLLYFGLAIFSRFILVHAPPLLSDDYYRFIWDGLLWHNGINPLLDTPRQLIEQGVIGGDQFDLWFLLMNSKDYHTIYPPLHQLVFYISTGTPYSIQAGIIMNMLIFLSEIWAIVLLIRLLNHFNKPTYWALIYALNPLIIIELTGNLHFESFMISFLLASFLALAKKRFALSGALMASLLQLNCCH